MARERRISWPSAARGRHCAPLYEVKSYHRWTRNGSRGILWASRQALVGDDDGGDDAAREDSSDRRRRRRGTRRNWSALYCLPTPRADERDERVPPTSHLASERAVASRRSIIQREVKKMTMLASAELEAAASVWQQCELVTVEGPFK